MADPPAQRSLRQAGAAAGLAAGAVALILAVVAKNGAWAAAILQTAQAVMALFVGLGLNQKVWSFTALSRDIATLLNEPRAVLLIQKIIGEVFCGALLQMPEFSLNFALLHTWLAKHASVATASN